MTQIDLGTDALVGEWLSLPDVAGLLGIPVGRVKQLLRDCGFDEPEALRWLFTADESLPGTPIDAIVRRRSSEVNRRAQALAF